MNSIFLEFIRFCQDRGLSFNIHYSEAEDMFDISASGLGENEYWEVKNYVDLNQGFYSKWIWCEGAYHLEMHGD